MKTFFTLITILTTGILIAQVQLSPESYIVRKATDVSGKEMVAIAVPGKPPVDFRMPQSQPVDGSYILSNVPAYDWSFGCSATCGAMMAGYYDRTGYVNVYTGPSNSGVAPLDNSMWGSVVINGEIRSQCPLSATMQGLDNRPGRGHVDDYWIQYGNTDLDPYITNSWVQHAYGDCTGDFMKTNQSAHNNSDGSTTFWYYVDGSPTVISNENDGLDGLRLFFESRGYNVSNYYNQYIYGHNGNTLGFTFQNYKQQIDAGRPVIIQIAGHSMLGTGYNDAGSVIYLHDTWDYVQHQMNWGGTYADMQHYGVAVLELQPAVYEPCASFLPVTGCGEGHLNYYSGGGTGVWFNATNNPCGSTSPGMEQIYRFEALYTGVYSIQVTASEGAVNYFWQTATCASTGWNCIGEISAPGEYAELVWTAGTTYYILLDDRNNVQGVHSFYLNCPNQPLPFSESFNNEAWPDLWQQTYSGSITSNRWNVNNSNNAGGTAFEMRASWTEATGISRLILPPLNTDGFEDIQLSFRQFYDDWGPGCTLRIQTSTNLINWANEAWSYASGSGNIAPILTDVPLQYNIGPTTYIAFVIEGNHYQFDFWYVDNIMVSGTPSVPENLFIQNQSVEGGISECFNAAQTITVAGGGTYFTVAANANAELIAGMKVVFLDGTVVMPGGYLHAHITNNSEFCLNQKSLLNNDLDVNMESQNMNTASEEELFSVFPNPGNGVFYLNMSGKMEAGDALLTVYDLTGESILQLTISEPMNSLSISGYPSGVYLLRVIQGNRMQTRKLVVQ